MSEHITTRQRHVAFRAMIADIFTELTSENAEFLALVYEEERSYTKPIELADMLLKQHSIQNYKTDLVLFGENLVKAKRNDLQNRVQEYIQRYQPPPNVPEYIQPFSERVTSTISAMEKDFDFEKQLPVCLDGESRGKKRKRTEEEEDIDTAADAIKIVCDSTSDGFDEGVPYEATPDDKKFMKQAQEVAKNSEDKETKVGAVLVKDGEAVGIGWNRMPLNCERLPWVRDRDKEPFEAGKHLYVVYGTRAAIFDAYKKKADLTGAALYTTLFPSNICAQCIREAGISKVVWCSDKFHKTKVMNASRRILRGIECRQYNEKD